MDSDAELLHAYANAGDEAAFRELVERHLPIVYSAALRRVGGDSHQARDIAQVVFTTLARKSAQLRGHPLLSGWLYTTTQHVAMKSVRTNQRRQAHERLAPEPDASTEPDWNQLRPVIDDALLELSDRDRHAVILRYFQGRPYSEIGARLGLAENTARMRVDRALDLLHAALARRGIKSTGAAIGVALASQAIAAVPAGLAAAISAGATAAGVGGGVLLFMSTSTLKTGLVLLGLAAAGTGFYLEHRDKLRLQSELDSVRTERRMANTGVARVTSGAESDRQELERLRAEVAELKLMPPPNATMAAWALRMVSLKDRIMQSGNAIPELRFLTEADWLDVSKGKLETDEDFRKAMASARSIAEGIFATKLQPAVRAFSQANGNAFPRDLAEVKPFLGEEIEPAILDRYEIVPASSINRVKLGGDFAISQKAPVDEQYDRRRVIGATAQGWYDWSSVNSERVQMTLMKAFTDANPGKQPRGLADLAPYATTPEQQAYVQKPTDSGTSSAGATAR